MTDGQSDGVQAAPADATSDVAYEPSDRAAVSARGEPVDANASDSIDQPTVFVVDDDEAVCQSLAWLIASAGLRVECYSSPSEFLEQYDHDRPGCLVLDIRMPDMDGLTLYRHLQARGAAIPVIVISGHADVTIAVQAMKTGAIDFLEKPFKDQVLLDRIHQAIRQDKTKRAEVASRDEIGSRYARLTPRERETMALVVTGMSNRIIAEHMGVSPKTVEAHRANVVSKMQASNLVGLVRMAITLAGGPDRPLPGFENEPAKQK
jgi:FixJ family two-component response regulator